MEIREQEFAFSDLTVDLKSLQAILGFPDSPLPAPFDEYLEEALEFATHLTDIRAAWRIIGDIQLDPPTGRIIAGGQTFLAGKTVCKELKNAEELLFFVCTAGKSISQKADVQLSGADPAKGYIYDQVGIFLAEAIGNRLQQIVKEELGAGKLITNMYSPGYCHWDVADQHRLFALFPAAPCGVTLTDSALMNPVKSISGVIGIGKDVSYREYPCALCLSVNCIYRRTGS
ncbi:MAG TPA: vitamin B12 dependent-methionine synthase activation domain-containing protein [Prolixibacteraceae bacterium]|nr:vitamin B12 dependent-methionine synthase activation domain-containing protein [Prolixibacteraceae bacterium]